MENLKNIRLQKYEYPPEEIEQKQSILQFFEKFMIFIDFLRLNNTLRYIKGLIF